MHNGHAQVGAPPIGAAPAAPRAHATSPILRTHAGGGGVSTNVEPPSSFPWRRSCCRRLIRGTASHHYGSPYSASLPLGGGDGTLAATCCAVAGGASHAPDGQVGLSAAAASGRQFIPAHYRTRQLAHCQPRFPAIHLPNILGPNLLQRLNPSQDRFLAGMPASLSLSVPRTHARTAGNAVLFPLPCALARWH